ncbi:hypothetical protein [Chelativorans sp. Marseille-P2723]|uniref:hypothetical protein n=1 Tax=Chelativorans sp. Marseille-P2723 TaxID=2709133 RepID=UPI0015704A33|nr:hypothetical protein [Chelativorans sp. Marseille-P2723]
MTFEDGFHREITGLPKQVPKEALADQTGGRSPISAGVERDGQYLISGVTAWYSPAASTRKIYQPI